MFPNNSTFVCPKKVKYEIDICRGVICCFVFTICSNICRMDILKIWKSCIMLNRSVNMPASHMSIDIFNMFARISFWSQWEVQWVAQLAVQWDALVDPAEPYGASGFGIRSIPNHAQFLIFTMKHWSKQYVMLYHEQPGLLQVGKERQPKFTQNMQSRRSV